MTSTVLHLRQAISSPHFMVRCSGSANEDEPEERRLIGGCYIRGMIHGEGLYEDGMRRIFIILCQAEKYDEASKRLSEC